MRDWFKTFFWYGFIVILLALFLWFAVLPLVDSVVQEGI